MSIARGFGINARSLYSNVAKPTEINMQFTVAAADTGGLGVTSLKSNGYVQNVFMNTSQTPGANNGYTNPNPAAGYILVQLKQNFNVYLGNYANVIAQNSGSSLKIDNNALTAGNVYVITTLGNATLAKWQSIGVPVGVTPAVGVAFVATAAGGAVNTSTSRVQVPSVSGIGAIESVGNVNVNTSSTISANGGQWMLFQCLGASFTGAALAAHSHSLLLKDAAVVDGATTRVNAGTNLLGANTGSNITVAGGGANGGVQTASAGTPAGTIAFAVTAPTDGAIISMKAYFDGSSVTVDGL